MRNKIIGIIGGMGPESTTEFYLDLIRMSREEVSAYPSIVTDSLPIDFGIEEKFIKGQGGKEEYLRLLTEAIRRLEKVNVDFIVIPCNTVHIFIDILRTLTKIPIISITEETARLCSNKGLKRVGVLATKLTMENRLYEKEFDRMEIRTIKIDENEQAELSDIIHKTVIEKISAGEEKRFENLIEKLKTKGSDAIVLGCTELQLLIKKDFGIEIIDSMYTLVKSTFRRWNN